MARSLLISLLVLLVAGVTGCGDAHRYDGRLLAVDSLMKSDPDSALALVEAVSPDSLHSEGDRAYRDLLLTQARYKCYVKATSDSDINRALDYYSRHTSDREKLTRSYIYKGAVMEELNHPDSAMYYYKTAEATAAPDDYANLGQINLRIAVLYQTGLTNDSAVIDRMTKAAHYFEITRDTSYLIYAIGTKGAYFNAINKDSARIYIEKAINLAREINSPTRFQYQSKLAGMYFYDGDYNVAKDLATDIFYNGRNHCNERQFYYYAARSYIRLDKVDSARWLIAQIPVPYSAVDSMNHYLTLAELAQATRQYDDYARYEGKVKIIDTRIMEESRKNKLTETELKWDTDQLEIEIKSQANYRIIKVIAIILLAITLLAAVFYFTIRCRFSRYQGELESTRIDLQSLLNDLEQNKLAFESEREDLISRIEEKDIKLAEVNKKKQQLELEQRKVSDIVRHRQSAINELYENIRIKPYTDNGRKRPLLLMSTLRELYENRGILQSPPSQSFWNNLRYSVEGEYHGIVTFVEQNYSNLSEDDIHLFMLLCAGFPNKIIKICMNYTNDVTVSKNKKKLLSGKMGIDVKFDDFIQLYLQGKLPLK